MPKQCVKILFSPIFCFVKLLSYVCLRKRVGANSLREQSIVYTYIYSSHLQAIPDNDVICRHPLACPVVDIHLVTDFVHTFAFSFWLTITTIIIHISLSRNLNCDQQQSLIVVQNNYYIINIIIILTTIISNRQPLHEALKMQECHAFMQHLDQSF